MFESQECIAENYAVLLARYLEPSFFEIQEDNMNVCCWKRAAWSCPLYFCLPFAVNCQGLRNCSEKLARTYQALASLASFIWLKDSNSES